MAYLHHMNPNFNTENGQVGAILSSKAFVQMAFNPLVSLIINRLGYELTLILGVAILLQSSFGACITSNSTLFLFIYLYFAQCILLDKLSPFFLFRERCRELDRH